MLESNGDLNALLFGKSETNPTVVLAGLSVLLRLSLIGLALPSERTSDSPLKISFLAALLAEMVATEVIPFLPCNTTLRLVSSLVISTELLAGAKLTLSPLALITLTPPSILLALVNSPPLLALSLVMLTQLIPSLTIKISTRVLRLTKLRRTKMPSRPKSSRTDQSKSLSLSTKISLLISQVFTNIRLVRDSVVTQSRWLVGVLKTVLLTGLLLTLGTKVGVTVVPSESREETTNAVLKDPLLLLLLLTDI
jgi:hypothetical protein